MREEMNTTPPPPTKHDHPDAHSMIWTQSELVWIQNRDAQWMERIEAERRLRAVTDDAYAKARERINTLEADRKMLREALEYARGSLSGARSKARENPNLAESTCLHGISRIDEIVREVDARIALENAHD